MDGTRILRKALELKFKGKRPMGQSRTRMHREDRKEAAGDLLSICLHEMETMLGEEICAVQRRSLSHVNE
jgi:hypothetical protein